MHACMQGLWVIIAKRTAGPSRKSDLISGFGPGRGSWHGPGPLSVFMIHAGAGAGLSVLVVGV